ncbi:hypothetical protein [Campylobacter sp. 2014D-0216]|uniref:hypothetical protein n=1 Tax=Campylobacter sp. 2014D-0216 TaxID=1813595 RepID=UPI0018A4A90F|nr:hypothetical protein [Campylobacter sp. 2014D-0216]QOR00990.1 hypothetical protein A0083_07035 [Campylobacter sp. 2014D-0216]
MVCEVQRRFLVENNDFIKILQEEKISYSKDKIRVFFTRISPFCDVKYKKINQNYFQFSLYKLHDILDKKTRKLSKKEFKKQYKRSLTKVINKTRISFQLSGNSFYLYRFKGNLQDLTILKAVFPTFEKAKQFNPPLFLKTYKEISEDENFYSKNLALYGDFSKIFDSARCIKILDKQEEISLHFPSQIQSFKAGKILLFVLFKRFKKEKIQFLQKANVENLKQFYTSLSQINIFFDLFTTLFEASIQSKLKHYFVNLKQQIDITQIHALDLERYVFILSDLKIHSVMLDLEFILKNEHDFYQGAKEQILKRLIAFKLRKELVFLKKKIVKSHSNLDEEIERIKFLLCYFATMFEEKNINKLKSYFVCSDVGLIFHDKKIMKKINKITKKLKIYS